MFNEHVIIITGARFRRAAGESDAVNPDRFLYICRALANEINQVPCYVKLVKEEFHFEVYFFIL